MRLRGGSGLIQDQSQCGFRAFVQHRLKARARRELTVGLTPSDRGTLLHDALFHLWGNLQDSETLHKQDETQLLTLVNLAAENALEKFSSRNRELVGKTYLELEQSHLELLLRQWLDVERQRSAFVVKARETDCELQLGKLHIRLRIDRIDLLPDGTQFIVDYKSGNAQVRYWLGPRPSEPQLPLYSEALGDTVSGIGFAVVRPQDIAWRGLARDSLGPGISTDIARAHARQEEVLEDWDALRLAWQQTLQALAQQFVDGEARVDPLDANLSCRWCGLQPLCRIVEVSDHGGH
jgi:ATP-dependent helicase/nuclease subunit B